MFVCILWFHHSIERYNFYLCTKNLLYPRTALSIKKGFSCHMSYYIVKLLRHCANWINTTEKTTLFVSGQIYEPLSQSENDGPQRNSRSYSTSFNSRCFSIKRRASDSNTKLLVYEDTLKKQKPKHKSKSYGNLFPKVRNTMSVAFQSNINSSCLS